MNVNLTNGETYELIGVSSGSKVWGEHIYSMQASGAGEAVLKGKLHPDHDWFEVGTLSGGEIKQVSMHGYIQMEVEARGGDVLFTLVR